MWKRILLLSIAIMCLSGCKKEKTQAEKDLTAVLPSGKEIYLYMPKKDAAAILGEPDGESTRGVFAYLDENGEEMLSIGYTEGKVSYLALRNEAAKVGEFSIGDTISEFDGSIFHGEDYDTYGRIHEFRGNEKVEEFEDLEFGKTAVGDYGTLFMVTDKNGAIETIAIWDAKTSFIFRFDIE